MEAVERNLRKSRVGIVVSDKMEKTIVVAVEVKYKHPLYKKTVRVTNKYKVHDEENAARIGDTVEITDTGRVVVNGNTMIESNIFSHTEPYEGFIEYPITLQPGECFVLADLRNGGADSRFFGPVSEDEILGTVITIARRNNL